MAQTAHHITYEVCEHEHLHVVLHDKDGAVIAQFQMDGSSAVYFGTDIIEQVLRLREERADTIGQCVGHA